MRPLDPLRSIKTKLGALIVAAVVVTIAVNEIGVVLEIRAIVRWVVAGALGLLMVQLLARGMTSPLREMADAAARMAAGDYSQRVHASSRDEVGDLARAFNQMAADLAEVDRMRRDLVANVSHELRTPISALQAVLENLVDGVGEPDPDTLRTMLRETERLGRLVAQLLDLSRLESGAVPLDLQTFAAKPFLERASRDAAAARRQISGGDVVVDVRVHPDGLTLHGDEERVHQVVTNLVDNALRHSPPGQVVQVTADVVDDHVRIAVADHGPGIPAEAAHRVFERFYRLDTARTADSGGSGLGLAIAHWIVGLHGGAIRAERNSPTGCRMVVDLPKVA